MTYVYVCGDVASRCQHELCKAADTTGMHSTNVCAPQRMGNCGQQSAFLLYRRQLPSLNLGYSESFIMLLLNPYWDK
jgi:hypothetical protein